MRLSEGPEKEHYRVGPGRDNPPVSGADDPAHSQDLSSPEGATAMWMETPSPFKSLS